MSRLSRTFTRLTLATFSNANKVTFTASSDARGILGLLDYIFGRKFSLILAPLLLSSRSELEQSLQTRHFPPRKQPSLYFDLDASHLCSMTDYTDDLESPRERKAIGGRSFQTAVGVKTWSPLFSPSQSSTIATAMESDSAGT